MSLLYWNCQRLWNSETVRNLCQLVKEKKSLLVFFMETKMNNKKIEFFRIKLKFDNIFVVESVGEKWRFGYVMVK
jgi:hypothetical protein